MSNPSIKPNAAVVWSKQTEKLKKKISEFMDGELYFDQEKMEEILLRFQSGTKKDLFQLISKT